MTDRDGPSRGGEAAPSSDPVRELVDALLEGDRQTASRLFEGHFEASGSFLTTIDELVQPAMARIGTCWENGEVSVAEEHLATATMQTVVARSLPELPRREDEEREIVLACVEDNEHVLGLRVLSDAFELAGWKTRFLGADVPTTALVEMVERWRPDAVALSLSMPNHVATAREVVEAIRGLGEPQPRILAGGSLEAPPSEVLEKAGADAWARNLSDGIEAVRA